jgi:hypothetical protein
LATTTAGVALELSSLVIPPTVVAVELERVNHEPGYERVS